MSWWCMNQPIRSPLRLGLTVRWQVHRELAGRDLRPVFWAVREELRDYKEKEMHRWYSREQLGGDLRRRIDLQCGLLYGTWGLSSRVSNMLLREAHKYALKYILEE